MPEFPL